MAPSYIVFFGTFVHHSRANSKALAIQQGALWVSTTDGRIKGTDWTIVTEGDLRALLREKGWVPDTASHYRRGTRVKIVQAREDQNEFFFPGFIDTHMHAPQYPNTGLFGDSTLLDWLKKYTFPMEASFGSPFPNIPSPRAYRVYNQVVSRTLASGTTFASYFATIHVPATNLLATLCQKRGQRALIGRVCMDHSLDPKDTYKDASTEESIEFTKDVISYIQSIDPDGTVVKPIVTPRFALSCTSEAMESLGALAASYDPPLHIQTHIAENKQEIQDVQDLYKQSYAEVYATRGLLTPRTILAHGVHLTSDEHDLIHKQGSSISHCPASNSALGSGICPVRTLLDKGITVGLGTDVSGGYSPSILETVRQACLVSRLVRHLDTGNKSNEDDGDKMVLSVEEALYLATRGGAKSVRMEDDIGGFDIGMFWDAQLIHLGRFSPAQSQDDGESRVDVFGWEDWTEKIHKWVWNGSDRNVKGVWVGGRLVYGRSEVECESRRGWLSWALGAGVVGVGAVFAFRRMKL